MSVFWLIVFGIVVFNFLWWFGSDLLLRRARVRWGWRAMLAGFALLMLGTFIWIFVDRFNAGSTPVPSTLLASAYIWHLVVLPIAVGLLALVATTRAVAAFARRLRSGPPTHDSAPLTTETPLTEANESDGSANAFSRRQLIASAVAAGPPLLCGVGLAKALWEVQQFRIRNLDIPIAGLPRDLEGLRIAQLSDVHVGRYTYGPVLRRMREHVNAMRPDIVVLTGDLIDHAIADLPAGVEALLGIDQPVFAIEGNHDLFDGREAFEQGMKRGGIPLLLNEQRIVRVRGVPIQLLGLRWGGLGGRGAAIEENMREVARLREPDAFQILLAHHPHAFDNAAALGIPLTLAGHTHGGQLMLSDAFGAGPLLFRYWSGLYTQPAAHGGQAACVVSNGVGNWFPLRVQAPAEILDLTLRRA